MRPRVPGMNEVDDAILEYFEELGEPAGERIELPPKPVHRNLVEVLEVLDRDSSTVARRMVNLEERGLLEKTDEKRAYYRITDKGRAYLAGELDADDLEKS